MFVTANRLPITRTEHLAVGSQVSISSGMGGTYTLVVKATDNGTFKFGGSPNQDLPSYFKNASFSAEEVKTDCFVLMPNLDYGLFQEHINAAKAAGYQTHEEICEAIGKVNGLSAPTIARWISRSDKLVY
ncbi:hypothetical protein [Alteromonas stellipolaris]|uniref:Uncharacterized protein n=1 Tax=Alteromonas stellipolaris TaxID=233316 RepID=A0ABM5YPX6_9ALTE|nr:hypothetical protein AVL57_00235 [Alteromonas stellipolaris]